MEKFGNLENIVNNFNKIKIKIKTNHQKIQMEQATHRKEIIAIKIRNFLKSLYSMEQQTRIREHISQCFKRHRYFSDFLNEESRLIDELLNFIQDHRSIQDFPAIQLSPCNIKYSFLKIFFKII